MLRGLSPTSSVYVNDESSLRCEVLRDVSEGDIKGLARNRVMLWQDSIDQDESDNPHTFERGENVQGDWTSHLSLTVYIVGQIIGLWVIFTRENYLSVALFPAVHHPTPHVYSAPHPEHAARLYITLSFLALVIITDLLYINLVYSDPGFVDWEQVEKTEGEYKPRNTDPDIYCEYCDGSRPMRSRHCHYCKRCVCKYDHHCFWIYNCVGAGNQRRFVVLLFLLFACAVWGNHAVWCSYTSTTDPQAIKVDAVQESKNILPMVAHFLGIPSMVFIFVVALCQVAIVMTNITSYEFSKRERIHYLKTLSPNDPSPFHEGVMTNLTTFISGNDIHKYSEV